MSVRKLPASTSESRHQPSPSTQGRWGKSASITCRRSLPIYGHHSTYHTVHVQFYILCVDSVYDILTWASSLNSWQKGQVCHLKDDTYPCMQPGKNTLTCKLICVNFWSRCWFYADFFLRWFIFLAFTLWVAAVAVTALPLQLLWWYDDRGFGDNLALVFGVSWWWLIPSLPEMS